MDPAVPGDGSTADAVPSPDGGDGASPLDVTQDPDTSVSPDGQEASVDSPAADGPQDGSQADAVDAPDGEVERQRCGAAPYKWLPSTNMGDVLESQGKASHSKVDLTLALLKLVSDKALKTTRLPKHNTKSALIRYQTQDRGKLVDATALVTWPDESTTFPILLFLHGTAGFNDACAPSTAMVDAELGGFTSEIGMLLSLYASFGYITVFPDYIGLKSLGAPTGFMHPYLVAEPTAIASLDSVRAAQKQLASSGTIPGDVVVIGGSQGGHAAAFVNRFLPHYAPELTIRGSVWDVPPTDLLHECQEAINNTWVNASDNVAAFLTAADSWYKAAPNGVSEVFLAPYDTEIPSAMMTECGGATINNPTLQTVYTPQILAAAQQTDLDSFSPWNCYTLENTLARTSIPRADDIPSLFLLGENDQLVNTPVERAAFQELCSQGLKLQYLECAGASHTAPLVYAFDQTLQFLEDRLDGKPMPADMCTVKPAEKCTSQP
ncbi:MAG: alpha/beta fold hydrolase [Deltaproteobacteria bacterium]|nr:alpha/beta fold hydrolase [Deltaproteobacteria bacterium]